MDCMDLFIFKGNHIFDSGKLDTSVFQKEKNNIILCAFRLLVHIKRKDFITLCNLWGEGVLLTRPFLKIFKHYAKFGSRDILLAISADKENYRETGNNGSDVCLVNEAECMLQMTFSAEEVPMESYHNIHTIPSSSLSRVCFESKIVPGTLLPFKNAIVKTFEKEKNILCEKHGQEKVFRNISISPVFINGSNIKKTGSSNKESINKNK